MVQFPGKFWYFSGKKICRDCGWEKFRKFFSWSPTFKRMWNIWRRNMSNWFNQNSIKYWIRKKNQWIRRWNQWCLLWQFYRTSLRNVRFFKKVKEEIKNENKVFNHASIKFINNFNHSVCISKFWYHFFW